MVGYELRPHRLGLLWDVSVLSHQVTNVVCLMCRPIGIHVKWCRLSPSDVRSTGLNVHFAGVNDDRALHDRARSLRERLVLRTLWSQRVRSYSVQFMNASELLTP